MKRIPLLVAIFLNITFSIAQSKKGELEAVIKKNKIKICTSYYFKNEKDSVIIKEELYDTEGFLMSSKMLYEKDIYTIKDSFFYDKNHYLIKKITYNKLVQTDVSTYINDEKGNMLQQNYVSDTFSQNVYFYYNDNQQFSKSITYYSNGDSSTFDAIYDKNGLRIKNIFYDKENGESTIVYQYNRASQLIKRIDKSKISESTMEYKYDVAGNVNEFKMESIYGNKKIYTKNISSYYAKGLVFETVHFMHHKPYAASKKYYTLYK